METQLSAFEQLLDEFSQLQPIDVAELSFFSIGSKGYFENPTTDILAFFCDSNGQHKLGATALKALLHCLPEEYHDLDCWLVQTPEREVATATGKRIDLLLEGSDWVMVLENKIFHEQNNPFDHYERYIHEEQTCYCSKKKLFVVLSPEGEKPPIGWHGVSYPTLIAALKTQLAEQFISQPLNKWSLLLREFVLHLESLMSSPSVNKQQLDFVLNNLSSIEKLQRFKTQAIEEYCDQIQSMLQNRLAQDVSARCGNWSGTPVLRFTLPSWKDSVSDVVLVLTGNSASIIVHVYAQLRNDVDENYADSIVLKGLKAERWIEGGMKKIRGYKIQETDMTEQQIIQLICDRLSELDKFEQSVHKATV